MTNQIVNEKRSTWFMAVSMIFASLRPVDAIHVGAEAAAAHSLVPTNEHAMWFIYLASIAAMGLVVTTLYWKKSAAVIFRIIIYLLCLCVVKMSVRYVFEEYHFNFPKFLTALHFLASGVICCLVLLCTSSLSSKRASVTWREMLFKMTPLSVVFTCSIGFGNAALMHSSTSFVEMMSSCTPVCTVIVAILFRQPFNKKLLWPVLVVCVGLAVCASGAMQFSMLGCIFTLLATFLRAVKAVIQQILMGQKDSKYEPVELLAWISLPSVVLMLAWSAAMEGVEPYVMLANASAPLVGSIGISCGIACILNVMATFVVKDLGAVGAQLTGQLKGVITVLGGMAVLNEAVYPQQAVGYAFVLLGVFWYTRTEAALKAQEKEEKESECGFENTRNTA
jgi:drug/metabolite transporter (DMT)-like permease